MKRGTIIFLTVIVFMVAVVVYGFYKMWKEHKELNKLEKELITLR